MVKQVDILMIIVIVAFNPDKLIGIAKGKLVNVKKKVRQMIDVAMLAKNFGPKYMYMYLNMTN